MMRKGDGAKVNTKPRPLTRARETPSENENRVEQIASLMRAGDWQRGKTGPMLAAQWRLSVDHVKRLSAEASRRVIREVTDPRTVTETVATVLSANVERASEERKYGEVARLADVWTRIVGARAPERVDVTVQTFASLPPATLLERVREQIRELRELERQLCEQLAITVHSEGSG